MIICKSKSELALMRQAGRIVAKVLQEVSDFSKVGISTKQLDELAKKIILQYNAKPAFLGYKGYPATLCTSINEEVVHGIPGKRILKNGDILSIDVGASLQGYFADAAVTIGIGDVSTDASNLMKVTRQSLYDGIEQARIGNRLYDISASVQRRAESHGYSVVRDFVGHGIGQEMHEDPQVPNFGERGTGAVLKEGMVLAIEPMVNTGEYKVSILPDNWTVVTADKELSAHFEHSVAITEDGPLILTEI